MTSTAGSTVPTAGPPERVGRVRRFGRVPRLVHRSTGLLMLVCLTTAACLYLGPLAQLVGRRRLVVTLHEWSGLLLPVPLLLGLLSRELRADLRRLNRLAAGKFNAGQKLYSGWIAGAVLIMLSTGLLMWFTHLLPFLSRTSAIFVHDCLAGVMCAGLTEHTRRALRDPEARRGMRTGYVSRHWARRQHPRWLTGSDGRDTVE
ncbi:cytochrome b/b6 domain-containing protein [Streptacidiphilus jiangxiensis]|uniref:Formate dehydrogenase subunit gamma n=1 Tax=Streptacidiphilus jiangxiensis TaxID=235985 RepID=A0A1H7WG62_STRJI|nr:cytochrome b/b6 domain-containing protein [Streptacidiphilus jiangxiensis]SEM20503.1 formate dehydrogenase subunit gamma [Streptacidiphilus jiangxiensis]